MPRPTINGPPEERIPVAAPRGQRTTVPEEGHRSIGAEAGGAGMTIVCVMLLFAAGGVWLGDQIDTRAAVAGGLIGGFAGVIAAFAGAYVRYRDL